MGVSQLNNASGNLGTVFYAQVTADQTGVTTEVDVTGLTTSGAWTAETGRRYKVTAQFEITQSVAGDAWVVEIKDASGPTTLKRITGSNGSTFSESKTGEYVSNASISGAKTWKLTVRRAVGSGTITFGASSTYPAFLMIEDIGPL